MDVRALLAPPSAYPVTVRLLERLRTAGGATIGILIVGIIGMMTLPAGSGPLLIAPLGATAVLLFAVPASPLRSRSPSLAVTWSPLWWALLVACSPPEPSVAAALAAARAAIQVVSPVDDC